MGRKSRLFPHSISSLNAEFASLEVEITESLRPYPQIFPFCGDYRRRLVRSRLPPETGSAIPHTDKVSNKSLSVRGFMASNRRVQFLLSGCTRGINSSKIHQGAGGYVRVHQGLFLHGWRRHPS